MGRVKSRIKSSKEKIKSKKEKIKTRIRNKRKNKKTLEEIIFSPEF